MRVDRNAPVVGERPKGSAKMKKFPRPLSQYKIPQEWREKLQLQEAEEEVAELLGEETLKMYHGTSMERARMIMRAGLIASTDGCLGPGIYVARKEKALRFALNNGRHGGQENALVTVLIKFRNPKVSDRVLF